MKLKRKKKEKASKTTKSLWERRREEGGGEVKETRSNSLVRKEGKTIKKSDYSTYTA